jgi:predicted amidohydrolase
LSSPVRTPTPYPHTPSNARSANQFQENTDFPADYPANVARAAGAAPEVWSRGGTCIVGPMGDVLAGPIWDKEGIIYAEVSKIQQCVF